MYILDNNADGQLGGFLEMKELELNKHYTLVNLLYTKIFHQIDMKREKHRSIFLIADKWGFTPRTFRFIDKKAREDFGTYIGTVVPTKDFSIIHLERHADNKQDPYVTIMDITHIHDEIDVVVKEKFRYSVMRRVLTTHKHGLSLRNAMELLDRDIIDPNFLSLVTRLDKSDNRSKTFDTI